MKNLLVDIFPEYYENFAVEGMSRWNAYLKQRILDEVKKVTSIKKQLLDAGMGTGHMFFELRDCHELDNYHFNGIDIDARMINFCQ
ncbi:class I SAM-dependent methyltransferase [Photorhabdus antumapuensis]|uniref:class I SAM-dependent methyltransferase n=1 Tax=Photorhabdus antumapuensis TaxID=2862867 RepID=UPI001CEDD6B3|nr:class I SAM-dependent methyltransferase [Photorhabdus antumapuensis]MCA6219186.1 class I SAM-dependent methyltransferase [Photorhabdus antumapuensis]